VFSRKIIQHVSVPLIGLLTSASVANAGLQRASAPADPSSTLSARPKPATAYDSGEPKARASARGPATPCTRLHTSSIVNIAVGKSAILHPDTPIMRVLLGSPDHSNAAVPVDAGDIPPNARALQRRDQANRSGVADVDVVLLSPQEIYLLGKSVGTTNVVLVGNTGECTVYDVAVSVDTLSLEGVLRQIMPDETGIKVISAADSIILTGSVSDPFKADRAVALANAYVRQGRNAGRTENERVVNMLSITAPQQVLLEVKIAEVSKTLLDQLGANVDIKGTAGSWAYNLLGNFASGAGGVLSAQKGLKTLSLTAEIDNGLVKILAEPNVIAMSGQEGSFLAGGRIFIPVVQSSGNSSSITLQEKEFGVGLRFTPTVLENGRISLKLAPEVSDVASSGLAVGAPGTLVNTIMPVITTRRAATTIELYDGQTFAIGGLIKNNSKHKMDAIPGMGEVPVLGALFRSTEFQLDRSELLFVATVHLVKPAPSAPKLPTDAYVEPTRPNAYFGSKMEGSFGQSVGVPTPVAPDKGSGDAPSEKPVAAGPAPSAAEAPAGAPGGAARAPSIGSVRTWIEKLSAKTADQ
jgi:pilus assembly protein CpaC